MSKLLKEHKFILKEGKEELVLRTFFYEGSKKQSLSLEKTKNGYCVDVFEVQLTPANLRRLADELEEIEKSLIPIPEADLKTLENVV